MSSGGAVPDFEDVGILGVYLGGVYLDFFDGSRVHVVFGYEGVRGAEVESLVVSGCEMYTA